MNDMLMLLAGILIGIGLVIGAFAFGWFLVG